MKKINGKINQILYERTERKWETDTVKQKQRKGGGRNDKVESRAMTQNKKKRGKS